LEEAAFTAEKQARHARHRHLFRGNDDGTFGPSAREIAKALAKQDRQAG